MRQLAIQLLLIAGILAVAWRLLVSYGQRAQAVRRIGLLLFAAFAVWSILDPSIWNRLANLLGIGRGADLILYGLVVAFFGFVVTTFRRFRDMEIRYTRLARRIALDEAESPSQHADEAKVTPPLGSQPGPPAVGDTATYAADDLSGATGPGTLPPSPDVRTTDIPYLNRKAADAD